jgi:hypothetical protein
MRMVVAMAVIVTLVVAMAVVVPMVVRMAVPLGGHGSGMVVFAGAAGCRCMAMGMALRGVGMGGDWVGIRLGHKACSLLLRLKTL